MAVPFLGADAVARGLLTREQLRYRYAPVYRGAYLPRGHSATLRERISAARLVVPRAVIAGVAASALHGAKCVDDDVTIDLIGRCRPQPGLKGREETLCAGESMTVDGIPVTTPARTAFDIGRRLDRLPAITRLDALMNACPFSIEEVMLLAKVHYRARGLVQLREALPYVDGGAESPKETWLRMLFVDAGLPITRPQFVVRDETGGYVRRIDLVSEEFKVGAEYDGEQHLKDRRQYEKDIWADRELQRLGWDVFHVIKEDRGAAIVEHARAVLLARGWRP